MPLDEAQTAADLRTAYDEGYRSIAIVLMHGYRYPGARAAGRGAGARAGFTQVSVSHEVSPLMKLVGARRHHGGRRLSVADPAPLRRAGRRRAARRAPDVHAVERRPDRRAPLPGQGCDPVRARRAASSARCAPRPRPASTGSSASTWAAPRPMCRTMRASCERAFETQVAGVRMRAPMMSIHTVAAGGGSILHFDGARYRVGPDSAGRQSRPGVLPARRAAHRHRLQRDAGQDTAAVFPARVRRRRRRAARSAMRWRAGSPSWPETNRATGDAHAGAGGRRLRRDRGRQHGQRDQADLGAARPRRDRLHAVLLRRRRRPACLPGGRRAGHDARLHPSARRRAVGLRHGAGRPDRDARAGGGSEAARTLRACEDTLEALAQRGARRAACARACRRTRVRAVRRVHLQLRRHRHCADRAASARRPRWCGSSRRPTASTSPSSCPGKPLIAEAVSVEAIGASGAADRRKRAGRARRSRPRPATVRHVHRRPLARQRRSTGATTSRPGEPHRRPGDHRRGERDHRGRAGLAGRASRRSIIWCWSASTARPQRPRHRHHRRPGDARDLQQPVTCRSPSRWGCGCRTPPTRSTSRSGWISPARCSTRDGNLIANAPHMPVHLGSMGESIKTVMRAERRQDEAGRRLRAQRTLQRRHAPARRHRDHAGVRRAGTEILFYVGSRGHHADIGGITPGSMPPDSQGGGGGGRADRQLPAGRGRAACASRKRVALLASGKYPARNVQQNMADLRAQIAANEKGVQELRRMVEHFGLDVVRAYMRHVQDNAEESVRRVIDVLKDGAFELPDGQRRGDQGDDHDRPATGAARGSISPAPRRSCPTTSTRPSAVCMAAVLYVFRTLVDDDIPLNAGCLKPLEVIIPEGSMLRPRYPAAVVAGQRRDLAVHHRRAVRRARRDGGVAGHDEQLHLRQRSATSTTRPSPAARAPGRASTAPTCVQTHMTNSRLTDPEVLEWRFPVRLESFEIRRGSGGAGRLARRRRRGAPRALPRADDRGDPLRPPPGAPARHGGRRTRARRGATMCCGPTARSASSGPSTRPRWRRATCS